MKSEFISLQNKYDVINHLLQQTKQKKIENKKQLTLQEKCIVYEAIKI
jgi:hypothetical protein